MRRLHDYVQMAFLFAVVVLHQSFAVEYPVLSVKSDSPGRLNQDWRNTNPANGAGRWQA